MTSNAPGSCKLNIWINSHQVSISCTFSLSRRLLPSTSKRGATPPVNWSSSWPSLLRDTLPDCMCIGLSLQADCQTYLKRRLLLNCITVNCFASHILRLVFLLFHPGLRTPERLGSPSAAAAAAGSVARSTRHPWLTINPPVVPQLRVSPSTPLCILMQTQSRPSRARLQLLIFLFLRRLHLKCVRILASEAGRKNWRCQPREEKNPQVELLSNLQ